MTRLAERLATGPALVGTFSLTTAPPVAELLGRCGLDFVIVDCEHAETSPLGADLAGLVRAVDAGGALAIVRVLGADHAQIGRALDCGAEAVVVPRVEDAATARAAVRAATRPPDGDRGAAPVVRAAGYGTVPWSAVLAQRPIVGVLLESPGGVDHVEEVLDVEGVGLAFFGAFDLAVALGLEDPRAGGPEVDEARRRVYAAAAARDIAVADYAWSPESARTFIADGARMVAMGTDLSAIVAAFDGLRSRILEVDDA